LIGRARRAARVAEGNDRKLAWRLLAEAYSSTAALLSRVDEAGLAWVAADRAAMVAEYSSDPELMALASYRLGQTLLQANELEDAFRVVITASNDLVRLSSGSAPARSLHGSLLLTGAVAASRSGDRKENLALLHQAEEIAEIVGNDRNDYALAFGPSNVQLHRVNSAVDASDPTDAIRQAERVDPEHFPAGLAGRRAQLYLELAWAYGQQRNDPAVVFSLMEAERIAPESLSYYPDARDLLTACLRRERRSALPGLRPLAQRVGVLA
jgi:tetratricopeptide (TPR) repeat protein